MNPAVSLISQNTADTKKRKRKLPFSLLVVQKDKYEEKYTKITP